MSNYDHTVWQIFFVVQAIAGVVCGTILYSAYVNFKDAQLHQRLATLSGAPVEVLQPVIPVIDVKPEPASPMPVVIPQPELVEKPVPPSIEQEFNPRPSPVDELAEKPPGEPVVKPAMLAQADEEKQDDTDEVAVSDKLEIQEMLQRNAIPVMPAQIRIQANCQNCPKFIQPAKATTIGPRNLVKRVRPVSSSGAKLPRVMPKIVDRPGDEYRQLVRTAIQAESLNQAWVELEWRKPFNKAAQDAQVEAAKLKKRRQGLEEKREQFEELAKTEIAVEAATFQLASRKAVDRGEDPLQPSAAVAEFLALRAKVKGENDQLSTLTEIVNQMASAPAYSMGHVRYVVKNLAGDPEIKDQTFIIRGNAVELRDRK